MKFLIASTAACVVSLIISIVLFSFSDFDNIKKDFMSGKFNFDKNFNISVDLGDDDREEKTFKFNAQKVNEVAISSVASKVNVSSSDRTDVLLTVKAKKENLEEHFSAEINNGVLEIKELKDKEEKNLSSLFGDKGSRGINIDLEVPKEIAASYDFEVAFGEIKAEGLKGSEFRVKLAAGDLKVIDVEFKDLEIEAAAGAVELKNISFKKGFVQAAAGDIDMKGIKSVEKFRVEAAAGDIDLEMNQSAPKVKISAAAGDIDFSLSEGLEYNFKFKNSTTVGSLKLNPPHEIKDDVAVFGKGEGLVEVETMFGDVEVD